MIGLRYLMGHMLGVQKTLRLILRADVRTADLPIRYSTKTELHEDWADF